MIRDYQVGRSILLSQINFWIGTIFLLIVTLGAGLLIWHAASGQNPIANAMGTDVSAPGQY